MRYNFDEIIDRENTNSMNVEGFRSYIFHDEEGTMTFPFKDEEFVRMWVADMEFATPDVVIDAMKERLERRIFGYTKVFDPEYYQAFVSWTQRRYGWSFPKEHLLMSSGVIPALYALVEYLCEPEDKVLFVTPAYAYFKHAADYNHREYICSDLINEDGCYTMDFDDLEKKLSDQKVKVCIFCNPHNPSGRVWTEDELHKFGQLCIAADKWIISDEIHCDLLRTGKKHTPLAKLFPEYSKMITCMAPTKTFNMAGMALSHIVISDDGLRKIWKARYFESDNPLSIAGAKAAYEKGEPWLDELKLYLDGNFAYVGEYLKEHLHLAKYRISEATYLAWVDLSAYFQEDENLSLFFANEAGVLLEGGNMFVQNSTGFIRLNLACPRSVLQEGMKRICRAVQKKEWRMEGGRTLAERWAADPNPFTIIRRAKTDIAIRQEQPEDYRETEYVVREAFWNHFSPGCDEHYLTHVMRDCSAFVPELDFVAVYQGRIVGHSACVKGLIKGDDQKEYEVLSLGPISVLPEYQRRGIGDKLIAHTKEIACSMGFCAILLCGDPDYYLRKGFQSAEELGIRTADDMYAAALHICLLYENALDGVRGRYMEDSIYEIDDRAAAEFDSMFPVKEKISGTPSQKRFEEIVVMRKNAL